MNNFSDAADRLPSMALADAENDPPAQESADRALDTPPEAQYDRVVSLARLLFDAPIASLMLRDTRGRWLKANTEADPERAEREMNFCRQAMQDDEYFVILDTDLDKRFAGRSLVTAEPRIGFCAGGPLHTADGRNLGAMCILSPLPRSFFSPSDQEKLGAIAEIVCLGIELNRHVHRARTAAAEQIRALREANARIRNSVDYATMLAEIEAPEMPTERLTIVGMAAWRSYIEAGGILSTSMRSLRDRISIDEYRQMVAMMPGFAM